MSKPRVPITAVLAVCLVCCVTACSEKAAEDFIEDAMVRRAGAAEIEAPPGTVALPASTLLSASPSFGMPYRVWTVRGQLLVADQASGSTLHVLDGSTGALRRSVGRRGRGPGEFESVVSVDTANGVSGIVNLYDYNLQRVTAVSTDSLVTRGMHVLSTRRLNWRPESLAGLTDGRIFAVNASDSSVAQVIDSTGQLLRHLALSSLRVPPADSPFLRSAYKARVCGVHGTRAALAFRYTSQLVIADAESRRDVAANVPHRFGPSFIDLPIMGRRIFKGGAHGVRYAYLNCVATDQAIYALFSGRLIGKYDRAGDNAGRFVHRFDWSGRLTASWELDHDAFSLAVMDSMLVTIAEEDVPTLRRTRIPIDHHKGLVSAGATVSVLPASRQTEFPYRAQPPQSTIHTVLNITVADSSGGQARSWFAMVESRDDKGKSHRLQVFISPRAKAKDPQGNPIPLPGIEAGDRVKFWLKDIMRLSEPAQAFADSLQVATRGR